MPIGVLSSYDSLGCLRYLSIRTIFKMANIVTSQATSLSVLVVVLHHLFEIFPCFHYQTVLITDAKVIYYIGTAIRANGDLLKIIHIILS